MEEKTVLEPIGVDGRDWKLTLDTVTSAIDNLRDGRHFIYIAKELLEVFNERNFSELKTIILAVLEQGTETVGNVSSELQQLYETVLHRHSVVMEIPGKLPKDKVAPIDF